MNNFINKKAMKVAAIHLALSMIVWLRVPSDLAWLIRPKGFNFGYGALGNTEMDLLFILQPSTLLTFVSYGPEMLKGIWWGFSDHYLPIIFCVSFPIWSICFGWLFVKLDNWLNHFPVLGRRVI